MLCAMHAPPPFLSIARSKFQSEGFSSKRALMECDSAVTGPGQDVRQGKGSVSCNYRGSLSGGAGACLLLLGELIFVINDI